LANPNEFAVTVVVNGKPTPLTVNGNAQVRSIIPRALEESGNRGQPPDNWELRDASGQPIAVDQKVADSGIGAGSTLFLNLKAGVGG
jgi:hypothetical protein